MSQPGYDIAAIAAEAEKYLTQTPEDLEYQFKLAWARSRQGEALPHRGDDGFWLNARRRLTDEIIKNEDSAALTIGVVATTVVHWIEVSGINLTAVDFPVSLFVALVAKSVLGELKSRSAKSKPDNPAKKP